LKKDFNLLWFTILVLSLSDEDVSLLMLLVASKSRVEEAVGMGARNNEALGQKALAVKSPNATTINTNRTCMVDEG
jgi:hypothetical protein